MAVKAAAHNDHSSIIRGTEDVYWFSLTRLDGGAAGIWFSQTLNPQPQSPGLGFGV